MSNKFLVKRDLVEVSIKYIEVDDEVVVVRNEESFVELGEQVKTLSAKFSRPNNKLYHSYMDDVVKEDVDGNISIDNLRLKDRKFRILIREFIDDDGEKFELNTQFLDNINPDIARALIDAYDNKIDSELYNLYVKSGIIKSKEVK